MLNVYSLHQFLLFHLSDESHLIIDAQFLNLGLLLGNKKEYIYNQY